MRVQISRCRLVLFIVATFLGRELMVDLHGTQVEVQSPRDHAVYADNISSLFLVPRLLLSVPGTWTAMVLESAFASHGVAKIPTTTLVFRTYSAV